MINSLYRKFNTPKLILAFLMLAVYIAGVALAGGDVLVDLEGFALSCQMFILAPGAGIYRLLKMDRYFTGKTKFYSLYFVFGMASLIAVFLLASVLGVQNSLVIHGAYLLFFCWGCFKWFKFYNLKEKAENSQLVFLFLLFSFVVFIYAFLAVAKHAHPAKVGQIFMSQDFMWTVGNAESFKLGLPPTDIRFSGVTLQYHYLTELLTAAISTFTGISCYDILGFYMGPFMTAFFITAMYDLGSVYYKGDEGKTNLFALSFYALSCLSLWKALPNGVSVFNYSLLETVISNVNSQCTALGFLAVFCGLVVNMTRGGTKADIKYLAAALLAFVMLMFSKSPIAAIVALAMVAAAAVNLLTKNEKKKITALSCVTIAIFAFVYFNFLSAGTGKSTLFSRTKTLELGYFRNYLNLFMNTNPTLYKISIPAFMVIQTVCMAPFQTFTVLPRMVMDVFKIFKLSFEKLWFYAAIAGGTLAFYITYHEAFSQVYFIYVAIFFLNLLAVEYFDFTRFRLKNIIHYGLIVLSCVTTLFFYTNFGGSGIRQYLFHYDILEKYPYIWCVKAEDELAGEFLRDNMAEDELFITNRTHTGQGEGLSNVYTCFSGRQSYMEGFKYTVSNMGIDFATQVRPRLDLVGKVFGVYDQQVTTADEILKICKAENIRYVVYSAQFEGETTSLENFEAVFENGTVKIYKLY